jgi:hypothetical protein
MTLAALVNALLYELVKGLIESRPALAFHPLIIRLLAWCKPDWEQWKTSKTMADVDRQAVQLVEQWEKEERQKEDNALVERAKALFPDATVTSIEAPVPSVMIIKEASADASEGVKALGGEMRITSHWSLED